MTSVTATHDINIPSEVLYLLLLDMYMKNFILNRV